MNKKITLEKRILSVMLTVIMVFSMVPMSVFATVGESVGEGGGIYEPPGGQTEGGGGTYIPGEETKKEIWCTRKPNSISRSYNGTSDASTISIMLWFTTDGTDEIELNEGTDFTAVKTFDSADAGNHTVNVEITLIGEAAKKYKLREGEEKFTINGTIMQAVPHLVVSLSSSTCTTVEKILPLLSVEGAPEGSMVTYYYTPTPNSIYDSTLNSLNVEIDKKTTISDIDETFNTYYIFARSTETKNYTATYSEAVKLTVNEEPQHGHEDVIFQPWDGTDDIPYSADNSACIYLTNDVSGDITLSSDADEAGAQQLTLCLNGKKLNGTITVNGGGKLTLCNCKNTGSVDGVMVEGGKLVGTGGMIGKLTLKGKGPSVQLSGGSLGSIVNSTGNYFRIGTLLADGYAFKHTDGDFIEHNETITANSNKPVKDLTVMVCKEDTHKWSYGDTCSYCGKTLVAYVGDSTNQKYFTVLSDAIAYANTYLKEITNNNVSLYLLSDAEVEQTITLNHENSKTYYLNLNGHTLSNATDCSGSIIKLMSGKLYIRNGSRTDTGKLAANGVDGVVVIGGTLTVETPLISASGENCAAVRMQGSSLDISYGSISSENDAYAIVAEGGENLKVVNDQVFGAVKIADSYTGTVDLMAGTYDSIEVEGDKFPAISTLLGDYCQLVNADTGEAVDGNVRKVKNVRVVHHHEYDENGRCKGAGCFVYAEAKISGTDDESLNKFYDTFGEALTVAKAHDGCTLTVYSDVDVKGTGVTIDSGNFMLDLEYHGKLVNYSNTPFILKVTGGNIEISGEGDISTSSSNTTALIVEGGNVTISGNVKLMSYDGTTVDYIGGTLKLKGGNYLKPEENGTMFKLPEGKACADLLVPGYLFADESGDYISSDQVESKTTVKVIACTEHIWSEDGKCTKCQYACPHDSGKNDREASYFEKAICSICHCEYGDCVKDTIAPTGKIKIKERTWWQDVLHVISFGLFFDEEVTFEITAEDDSYDQAGYDKDKHAVKIEYLISTIPLSEELVKNSNFEQYTKPVDISGDDQYVVYAKLTDYAGNVAYASTDGFVIDTTTPVIEIYTYANGHTERYTNGQRAEACGNTQFEFIDENFDAAYVIIDGKKEAIWGNFYFADPSDSFSAYRTEQWITFEVHDKAGNISMIDVYVHKDHSFDEKTGICDYCGYQPTVLIKCSNDNNEVKFVAGDSFDETMLIAGRTNFDRFYLKLYGNIEMIASDGSYGSKDQKWTFDLNGYTLSNSPGVDPNSKAALFDVVGDITFVGNGAMNVDILLSGGSLTIDGKCAFKKLEQKYGTLTVNAGSFESLTISKLDVDWSYTRETTLYGGRYGEIKIVDIEGLTCADLLGRGYRFAYMDLEGVKVTELTGVVVELCYHEHIDKNYFCLDCGMQFVISVKKGNTETLFDTFEDAIRYAEQNDGCTVKLLQDITLDEKMAGSLINSHKVELTKGKYTLDLNGKTLDINSNDFSIYDNCNLTIGDSVGGGKITDSKGVGYIAVGKTAKLNVTGGEFTVNVKSHNQSALTLKGGSFKSVHSTSEADCSPFEFLADGYAFAFSDGSGYANEGKVKNEDGEKSISDVTVVNAPLVFNNQPRDKTYYLTMPNYKKWAAFTFLYSGGYPSKGDITITGERTDGTVVYTNTVKPTRIYEDGINLWKFTAEDSGQFRVKLEYNGYVLYSNMFNITVTECDHPGYDENTNKCTQCECDLAAAIIKDGKTNGYVTFAEALAAAQTDENIACSLIPLVDVRENISVRSGAFALEAANILLDGKIEVANGAELAVNGGTITKNVTCAKGGILEIIAGTYSGIVTGESGSTLIISGGSFTEINIADKQLVDCLKDGYAFVDMDTDKIIDGRVNSASNVKAVDHTHTCIWNTDTHEKICACGYVEATDTEAPVISGVENGKTYYGAVEFSVTDANDFIVTVDGKEVRLTIGSYIIEPDNKLHTITATDVAGNTASVTIGVNKLYHVTLRSGTGYTLTGEPLVGYGMDYTFTLEIAEGYSKTEDFMVDVNGAPMRSDSGSYTVPLVTSDIVVTVFGIADITPPEAEIEISTNKFNSFMNTITFGLFFKKTQTVTVTASDMGSGLSKVEYLLSETAFADKDAVTGDWTELTFTDGKASFDIEPNMKAYVYLRVTDASGNVQVINSDGVVAYTDSEAITKAVSFTMLEKSDVSFAVKLNGNTVKALYNGDTLIDSDDHTVSENGTITLKNSYLATLAAGEYTIRVTYDPLGEGYKTGDEPAMTSVKLTVEKITPELDLEPKTQKIYDGEPIDYRTINSSIYAGSVRVWEYKPFDADDSAYTTTAPKNAGKYTVRLTTKEDDDFKEASAEVIYEITAKKVTINGTTVESSKVYDGNTNAEITSDGNVNGLVENDKVTIVTGKATYSDKNVGTDKAVTFSEFSLAGDDVGNYVLSAQPAGTTANINPKELTVADLKVKDKRYDGKNTAEIDGTPTLVGVAKGDKLRLVNGTPAFDSVKIGKNIPISFTMFTIEGDSMVVGNYTLKQPAGITADIVENVANEITRLTDVVNGYDTHKVTSDDKSDIEKLISNIDTLLGGDNLTDTERAALEDLKDTAQALLDRIAAAKNAAEADEITAVSGITKDNVKFEDKKSLEKAEKALEDALHDFDGNYTEEERKNLEEKLETVKAALSAIGNMEKSVEVANSPKTGEASDLIPWIILLFISGGILTGTKIANKKKKHSVK